MAYSHVWHARRVLNETHKAKKGTVKVVTITTKKEK